MQVIRNAFLIYCIFLSITTTQAQELDCLVKVNTDQLTSSATGGTLDKTVVQDMEQSFMAFINNRKWTPHTYTQLERIKCQIQINITSTTSLTRFIANAQIVSVRPVYNSNYESVVLSFIDKDWEFEYSPSQQLNYNENAYVDNLTSMLSYYVYIILGFDYDTFSKMGGQPYFEKAQQIVNNAQESPYKGWKAFDGTYNRYWLIENLINTQLAPIRESIYEYHRLGLDVIVGDAEGGRSVILNSLNKLKSANDLKPGSALMRFYMNAKGTEIVNIMSEAGKGDKQKAYDILKNIDPTNLEQYNKLLN